MQLTLFRYHKFIIHIRLVNNGLNESAITHVPNLRTLDLRGNNILVVDLSSYATLENLKTLKLSQNPLSTIYCSNDQL